MRVDDLPQPFAEIYRRLRALDDDPAAQALDALVFARGQLAHVTDTGNDHTPQGKLRLCAAERMLEQMFLVCGEVLLAWYADVRQQPGGAHSAAAQELSRRLHQYVSTLRSELVEDLEVEAS